jgi:hypothetical protein
MVRATWRNLMSSSRSRPWVRDSSRGLRETGVGGWVGGDQAVDVGEPEEASDGVHHRDNRGVHQPGVVELADVELDVSSLDSYERIESVALTPGEPALYLEREKAAGVPGVTGEVGDGG